MAVDTAQKRMSAIAPASPWRGPMVDATEVGFNVGHRQAADFLYSGISSGGAPPVGPAPAGTVPVRYLIGQTANVVPVETVLTSEAGVVPVREFVGPANVVPVRETATEMPRVKVRKV